MYLCLEKRSNAFMSCDRMFASTDMIWIWIFGKRVAEQCTRTVYTVQCTVYTAPCLSCVFKGEIYLRRDRRDIFHWMSYRNAGTYDSNACRYRQLNCFHRLMPIFHIFPYFMRTYVRSSKPEMEMAGRQQNHLHQPWHVSSWWEWSKARFTGANVH